MMKLSDREWKAFQLNDKIFSLSSSINSTDFSKIKKGANEYYPFITRTEKNNGIAHFVSRQVKKFNKSNVLIIGLDTQTVFYQPYKFYTGQNVQIFEIDNVNMNKYIALFIKPLLQKQLENLNWGGNGATLGRLRKKKVMLPVDYNGTPDYDFMEQYIKQKYFNLKSQIQEKQKHDIYDLRELNELEWKSYFIEDIFQIKSGKRLTKNDFIKGKKPFIGSTDSNNGITNYVGNKNASEDYNVLGVNYNGSVVENFYHPYKALFSDDVKRLSLKSKGNKYIYLFIKNLILNQKVKYQYGYKFNAKRMKKQIIKLPSINNQPDYLFMEQYMKRKENEILDRL